jgi:hypothetical protein
VAEPSSGLPGNGEGGRRRPPSRIRTGPDQRFFALDFLRAAVAFAVRRFRVAAAFFPAATRLVDLRVDLRAVLFLAVDFLRAGFLAVDFLAAVFLLAGLRAVDFLAAVFLRAVVRFLVAAAFLPAADRFAAVRLRVAAAFFAAADRFAAGLLRAAVFRAAIPSPFPPWLRRVLGHDAIRLRRRRSRSLMPPHTPYRSSRRSA